MLRKTLCAFSLATLLNICQVQAALELSVQDIPPAVDADTYTLTINTTPGAKITVTGGPTQLPPATDTDEDGEVQITVGLAQDSQNTFAIIAEKDGERTDSLNIIINENTAETGDYAQSSGKDITPPTRPILDDYPSEIDAKSIELSGIAESESTVFAIKTDGTILESVTADADGEFSLKIDLEQNKRNRINISARDDAGNTSTAIQAVIVELGEAEEEEEEEIENEEQTETPEETEDDTESTTAKEEEEEEEENNDPIDVASPFTDIAEHWAEEYIEALRISGIVGGKREGIFAPNDYLTRAELTKIALNAFDYNLKNVTSKPFKDVEVTAWFAAYVETAKQEGIVKGYNDGFRPNQNVTRAEALKILLNTAELEIPEASTDFIDVAEGAWYENYVAFAESNGIIAGYPDETFQPNRAITRAEIAKITVKTMELYSAKLAEAEEEEEEEEEEKETIVIEGNNENNETAETENEETDEFIDDNRLYTNSNFNFTLQYYKNWYYEGTTGSGDTIILVGFSDEEEAIENALATVELINDSLEEINKDNLEKIETTDEVRYYVEYNDTRHIEIYGAPEYADKLQIMAESLELIEN